MKTKRTLEHWKMCWRGQIAHVALFPSPGWRAPLLVSCGMQRVQVCVNKALVVTK